MKKLAYITYDFFLDVDYPIVKELDKYYFLNWIIIFKISATQRFTIEEVVKYAEKNKIAFEIITTTKRYRSLSYLLKCLNITIKLKKLKADIYYFQTFSDPYLPVFTKLFLKTKKIIVAIHDVLNHLNDNSLFRDLSKKFYTRAFNNFHIYSENQKDIFLYQYPQKNVMMARLPLYDFGPAKNNLSKKKINFLFFGVILYYKGVDYLIEAANLLAKEYDNFTVTIAGYAEDFSIYRNLIQNDNIFNLIIKVIPSNEIAEIFVNADYLVQPYRDVTQSGPLKIAYNYNIPVIASDLPGFNEYIIHGSTGYLFEPNNYKSLYEVMKNILNQSTEESLKIKKNLQEFVARELNLESIIDKYLKFFEKL